MKVLYLYDRMKLDGPGYLYAQRFVEFLQAHTFLTLRYALSSDDFAEHFDNEDAGFGELITASDFFSGGFDVIIQSGPLFQKNGWCRINEDVLEQFWKKGGITLFCGTLRTSATGALPNPRIDSQGFGSCLGGATMRSLHFMTRQARETIFTASRVNATA